MNEVNEDVIYDLEAAEDGQPQQEQPQQDGSDPAAAECETPPTVVEEDAGASVAGERDVDAPVAGTTGAAEGEAAAEDSGETAPETAGVTDPHLAELDRLVKEMGAETLLDIIRDNRNSAIRQIISEAEGSREQRMPAGGTLSARCSSIFDLAALA